jgi:uncharacterized membrane protein
MQSEEEQLITHLKALADCLMTNDAFWPNFLRQMAAEVQSLLERNADVVEKFDFINSNNLSTAGMGSINDDVVPETCGSITHTSTRPTDRLALLVVLE